jgi:hypothetical protein
LIQFLKVNPITKDVSSFKCYVLDATDHILEGAESEVQEEEAR